MDFPADWLPGASLTLSAVPAPHTDETRNGSYLHYSKRLATLLVLGAVSAAQMPVAMAQDILIQNVALISPERAAPMFHADVLLQEGRIAQIGTKLVPGPHSRPIDGSGRFLIPGLIDSHVHAGHSAALDDDAIDAHPELWAAYRDQLPRAFLAFGFTSVVDLDLKPSDKAWFDGAPVHRPISIVNTPRPGTHGARYHNQAVRSADC
jgi:hypothetical protein